MPAPAKNLPKTTAPCGAGHGFVLCARPRARGYRDRLPFEPLAHEAAADRRATRLGSAASRSHRCGPGAGEKKSSFPSIWFSTVSNYDNEISRGARCALAKFQQIASRLQPSKYTRTDQKIDGQSGAKIQSCAGSWPTARTARNNRSSSGTNSEVRAPLRVGIWASWAIPLAEALNTVRKPDPQLT
jgi:hypothetical protein